MASGEVVGLVKSTPANSENSINKISVHNDGTMEVNSLSSDKLIAGTETLIFNGNYENYFYETRELLAFVLNKTKEWISINLDFEISLEDEELFNSFINKRSL